MSDRKATTLRDLINAVEREAANAPDLLAAVGRVIKAAQAAETDPYTLVGVLLEGAAVSIAGMPPEMRRSVAVDAICILCDRLQPFSELRDGSLLIGEPAGPHGATDQRSPGSTPSADNNQLRARAIAAVAKTLFWLDALDRAEKQKEGPRHGRPKS
jgi:hypothetical protein